MMWADDSFAQHEVEGSRSANGLKLLDTESHMGGEGRLSSIQIQETQGINTIRGNTGTTYKEKKTNIEDVQALMAQSNTGNTLLMGSCY